MKIEAGKYYQNSKGLIRKVTGQVQKKHHYGTYLEWEYIPILAGGKEGTPRTCAQSTMSGWAKREWDPTAVDFKSPKRAQACAILDQLTGMIGSTQTFVDLCVDAAKEELRKELGI